MNWDECRKTILQAIALVGVNALAFIYDAEWLPLALGVDAMVLGVEAGVYLNGKRATAANQDKTGTASGNSNSSGG